ncbi:MAG: hypothetical protein ACREEE_07610 [Dongiaceae bacterium]
MLRRIVDDAMGRGPRELDARYLLRAPVRRWLFYAGMFVFYCQLVSAGLTGIYRYTPGEPGILDGVDPPLYDAVLLIQPPDHIGSINDLQAHGLNVGYSPVKYAAWAILPPLVGAIPLWLASVARTSSLLTRTLLLFSLCLGFASTLLIKVFEIFGGSLGWAFSARTTTNAPLSQPVHPIYGYVELVGGFFLPIAAYPLLAIFIASSTFILISRRLSSWAGR